MKKYESNLGKAFRSLRNQGIPASVVGITSEDGAFHSVMGFLLTDSQILDLSECGELHAQGIRQFVANFDKEAKRKPTGQH